MLGVLLVVAIVGFLAYARYRVRQIGKDLPAKLGLEIQQSTNDFTISKSRAGHTLFVLHAAKAVQYKGGGHAVLHDVRIEMYGKDGSRADRISGSQFDYDPTTKVARADGAVDIELEDPSTLGPAKKAATANVSGKIPIKVKTSGLIFNQDTQIASTDQALTFEHGDASGSARGAIYDASKGTLNLAHDVVLHSVVDDDPITVAATSASFDRNTHQLYLIKETSDYQQRHESADQAIVFFRPDGGADHITAEGNLRMKTDDGSNLQATNGRAQLDEKGALKQVKLDGGLLFVSRDPLHSLHIDSTSGSFTFAPAGDKKSMPTHMQLVGAVSVVDQQLSLPGDPHGSETRESRASQMDVDLAPDSAGHVQPQSVLANGAATFIVHTIHENAPQQITRLKGNQIYAEIADGHQLSSLRATGDTSIEQSTPGGQDQVSSADSLMVKFVPGGRQVGKASNKPVPAFGEQGSQIASAVQQGHATLVQTQPGATPGASPVKITASADRINYDGASSKIELSGGTPRIVQGEGSDLTAALIDFNRATGDATASGGIKATYNNAADPAKQSANGAMHVVADHASLDHAKNETTFYGAPHADARLWQGANAITAPTIVLSRARQLLTATGPANSVKATFVETDSKSSKTPPPNPTTPNTPSVVRTTSNSLIYSGGERKATLSGGVTVQDPSGTMRASTVDLFLTQNPAAAGNKGGMGPGGQVDRLIAEGHVQFNQGDRTGSGEKLVYTADDSHFVLTGSSAAPPRVTDPQHGTVTGSSLIFNNRDDSVVVSHGTAPTSTDTRTNSDHNHIAKPTK